MVELLVVIAVAGVLSSLLLPSLAKAKRKALQVKCINNLRQCGLMLQMIREDGGNLGSVTTFWPRALLPYAGNYPSSEMFRCPVTRPMTDAQAASQFLTRYNTKSHVFGAADTAGRVFVAVSPGGQEPIPFSYSYNYWLLPGEAAEFASLWYGNESNISSPSETPSMIDGNTLLVLPLAGGFAASDLYRDRSIEDYDAAGANIFVARHSDRAPPNVAYPNGPSEMSRWRSGLLLFDGHVEVPLLRDLWKYQWNRGWQAKPFRVPTL